MIEITLKELNDSYESLCSVADSLTAGKMKYRFAKVLNAAKREMEGLQESMLAIAKKHGAEVLGGTRFTFDPNKQKEQAIAYNIETDELIRTEIVKFDFDTKYFSFDEITKAEDAKKPITAASLSNLLWLISDAETQSEETPKVMAATA